MSSAVEVAEGSRHSRAAVAVLGRHLPSVLASGTIAIAATFLSEHHGGPVMLFALLLGMAFHFLSQDGRCVAGIDFAAKRLRRVAVALLGAQITLAEIIGLGIVPLAAIIAAVAVTIGGGVLAARLLSFNSRFGALTGGAVSICGASAALAIASVLPKSETAERDTAFTVIAVTTLSTIAMIVYPLIVPLFHLSPVQAGLFLGGTIHDVAQVVGAGFSVSEEAGTVATVAKLLRVALLLPATFLLAVAFTARNRAERRVVPALPGFLLGFAALVALNSLGLLPPMTLGLLKPLSRWCLVTAIAALDMKTSLQAMAAVGARAVALIVGETLFLAALVLAAVIRLT